MPSNFPWWTVFAVYDDNEQSFVHFVQAKDVENARSKALRAADGVILIAGIVPGKVQPVDEAPPNIIPIRGRGHTIEVSSVVVSKRSVVLPGRCPNCKADTRRASALVEVNLQHRYWNAHLSHNGKDLAHERGGKSRDGDMIETCAIRCSQCSHMIWDGLYGVE